MRIGRLVGIVIGVLVALILGLGSITIVKAGHVGVITRFGAVERVIYPGLNFKIPLVEASRKMDVRTQKSEGDASAASNDLQTVTSTIAVNWHLDGQYATWMIENIGMDYEEIVVAPAIQNAFKATTSLFDAEELITSRAKVAYQAEMTLGEKLAKFHIIVDAVNIVNFDFSPEYNAAIEAKQVAQQQVETAKQLLAKAQVEAQTAQAQAQGQADAQAALRDSGALSDEYLEYLALSKWDGVLPDVVGAATPFIDVGEFSK